MNHVYRIVFNRALGLMQVTSELASGRGASGTSARRPRPGRRSVLALGLALASGGTLAQVAPGQLPTGVTVVGGADAPTLVGQLLTINQTQDRALIRWNTFDIGEDVGVQFEQQSHQVALNQILDTNPSQIFGDLTAAGTIFLINPNGIVFGEGSTISVGSLVASTLVPDDPAAFLEMDAGAYVNDSFVWSEGGIAGLVINHRTISSADGSVVLLGGAAHNAAGGSIDVGTGLAALLAGGRAQVQLVPGGPPVVQITGVVASPPALGPSAGVINTGAISAPGGTIRLEGQVAAGLAATAVNNSGTLAAGRIGVGPDGTISLHTGGASGNMAAGGTIDAGAGHVALLASGTLDLSAALTGGGFTAFAADLQQTGGQVHVGGTAFVGASAAALLTRPDNDFGGMVQLQTGGAASITTANALTLGAVDVGALTVQSGGPLDLGAGMVAGALSVVSNGGDVTQSGPLSVVGTSAIDAGAGDITLGHGSNDFNGAMTVTGNVVSLRDINALSLGSVDAGSLAATAGGALSLGSGGIAGALTATTTGANITQTGSLQVGGTATIDAGTGDILLLNAGNDFGGAVDLSGRTALIVDGNALTLGQLDLGLLSVNSRGALDLGSGTIAGLLEAYSNDGAISQSGALTVGGASLLDAGAGDITLANAGNNFVGTLGLSGATVTVRDINALTLGSIGVDNLTVSSGGALSMGAATIGGDLAATSATGGITQTGALSVAGTSAIDAGAGGITLANLGNDFTGAVDLRGGAVNIHDANVLRLGSVDAGTLQATAATISLGGDVTTMGSQAYVGPVLLHADVALTAGGNVDFSWTLDGAHRLSVDADGAVVIGPAGSDTALAALAVDAGSFSAVSTIDVAGDLEIAVQAGGIAQSGAFRVGGNASFDAGTGSIDLSNTFNNFVGTVNLTGNTVSMRDNNALGLGTLDVGSLTAISIGPLSLGAGAIAGQLSALSFSGNITQTGALSVTGPSDLRAGGNITLAHAGNDFTGSVAASGAAVNLRDANSLTLGSFNAQSLTATAGGPLSLGTGVITGNLAATSANGGISQSAGLSVGGTSTIDAGAGALTLLHQQNDFVGAVNLRGGAVAIRDANALTLGQVDAASLHATAAAIGLSGDVTTSGSQQYDGVLDLDADLVLTSGGNVGFGATIDGAHQLSVDAGGAVTFADTVGAGTTLAGLEVDAGSFSAASTVDVAGDLSITVQTGGIAQSGAFTVGGNTASDAGTGNITLTNAGNDFAGAVSLSGGDAAIRDVNALALGAIEVGTLSAHSQGALGLGLGTIGGNLSASSPGGGITQSGALHVGGSSTLDAGGGAITLAQAGNDFVGAINLAGGMATIRDSNALRLGLLDVDALSASSQGDFDLGTGTIAGDLIAGSHGGSITQSGALRVDGASTIDAATGAITLASTSNDFAGTVALSGGAVSIRDASALTLGALDVGALTATSQGALGLGSGSIAGALVVDSAGGAITQAGALTVGGPATLDAGRAAITLANAGNDFAGAVSLSGGAVSIQDRNALSLAVLDTASLAATSHGLLDLGTGSVAGNLAAASNGAAITQSGALRVDGTSTLDAGDGQILLTSTSNDFGGPVGLTGGAIALRDHNDLTLSHLRSGPDANVQVVAGGGLTLPAQAIDTGTGSLHLSAQGNTLTIRAALSGGDITLQGAPGVLLDNDVRASGTLHLESGGDLVQDGGRIEAARLTGNAAGEARLGGTNHIAQLGDFSASGIHLANAGSLAVSGPVDAGAAALRLTLSEGELALNGRVSATDIRLEIADGVVQGPNGQLVGDTLSGSAGGAVVLGDATRFIDNQIARIGDFRARSGFSMTNGRLLTLASLNGSNFTIDAGTADFHLEVEGDLRQDGTDWLYNGRGTWVASGGIGLSTSPVYVMGLDSQVATLGAPPAYFHAVRPDGSLLPTAGDAVNTPTSVRAGQVQAASNRQVTYVEVDADVFDYRGYNLVGPGVRLPDDQQPGCDADLPGQKCEAGQ